MKIHWLYLQQASDGIIVNALEDLTLIAISDVKNAKCTLPQKNYSGSYYEVIVDLYFDHTAALICIALSQD